MTEDGLGEHGRLEAGGRCYEFIKYGVSDECVPTLVLMHEGLGSATMWGGFPARLHEVTRMPVFAFSRAGYGLSDDEKVSWTAEFMHRAASNELPVVLEAAEIGSFWLIGHSDGGSISLIYAGSPEHRRPGLKGLVLMAAHVFNEPVCVAGIKAANAAYSTTGLRDALMRYHGDRVDLVFERWRDIWLAPEFEHWNIETFLPHIDCPVMVVQGRDDPYGTLDQVAAIEAGLSVAVETLLVKECGHSPHRDHLDTTVARVAAFFEEYG